jgi:hypothetical protein
MKIRYFDLIFLFLLIFLFSGCRNSKEKIKEIPNGYLKTILISQPVDISEVDIIENLECIILEETDQSLFGAVSKMRVYKDKIYILDRMYAQALFIYTINGKHISTIGANKGQGPHDFLKLSNFEIDYNNDQLLVMDNWGRKFMIYDFDGNFVRRIDSKLRVTDAVLLPNDYIVHAKSSDEHKLPGQSNNKIIITDYNQNIIKEGFEYDDNENINIYSSEIIRSSSNGEIIFAPRLRDTIYNVTIDSIIPKYAVDYGSNKKISKRALDDMKEDPADPLNADRAFIKLINNGNMCFLGENVESDDYLYLSLGFNNYTIAVFYNKNTDNSIALSHNRKGEKNNESGLYSLLCSDDEGYFYGAFDSPQIDRLIPIFPELKDISDPDDLNPILFRYKIKNVE